MKSIADYETKKKSDLIVDVEESCIWLWFKYKEGIDENLPNSAENKKILLNQKVNLMQIGN